MSAPDPKGTNPQIEQAGASDESIQQVHSILLREKPEPTESKMPMPLFMLGFISAMVLTVAIYFVHNRGGFSPMVYDERFDPATAPSSQQEVKVDPVAQGKKLYNTVCAACHQATGMGVPGAFPPLAKSDWANGSEERVIRILLHGLSGPITVNGSNFNSVMPAIGPGSGYNFTDEKIAYVLTYVRQEWGNSAPAITPEKVKEIRTGAAAGRTTPWTASELEAIK
ncbi:MAG: cytochrome c [Nibricoccus sp.]